MSKPQMIILDGDGTYQIEVVGESHYRANLVKIAGDCEEDDVEVVKTAYLVPEPRNPNDPNAVRVEIDRLIVGYLPRPVAAQVSPLLRARKLVAIQAQARVSAFEGASHYSVWIDGSIDEILSEFAVKPWWKLW